MNRIVHFIFFIMALQICPLILNGQQDKPDQPGERVILFSDRTLYIAGEKILFSAFLQSGIKTNQIESSRILYCELVTPDGNKIVSDKFLIQDYSSSGNLKIPGDIITGIYYLRAYTRYMRNWGPSCYHYSLIKIVNAGRTEVQAFENDTNLSGNRSLFEMGQKSAASFQISTDKSIYNARDIVNVSIGINEAIQSSWRALSLSVVPENSITADTIIHPVNQQSEKNSFFHSETRGPSVTGKIMDKKTGIMLTGTLVNLSIIGRGRDFMSVLTDSAGRFYFSLPDYTGSRDLFLCARDTRTSSPKMLIDNDFCTVPVHIPTSAFTLTAQERKTAYNMAVNVQLGSYFNVDSIPVTDTSKSEDKPFYGVPNDILYIDNYVQLPTLEDYFIELPTLVKVRRRLGEKYLKVLGTQTGLSNFDPLILVDLVAIDNPAIVLAIPPPNISRIEVVNMLYVKGDQTYGGIINFISKHGDFAGIDLPSSGIFINYRFLADSSHSGGIYLPTQHFPDTRNNLYWDPKLGLDKSNSAKVRFTASDTPGKYLIILNGITLKGESFRQISAFEVRK
jgi:hypothetical protein